MQHIRAGLLALFGLLATQGRAHHAPSIYEFEQERRMTATVLAFDWVQPHTIVRVLTTDASGSDTVWTLEGMSPDYLGRRGWNRGTLAPGTRITVDYFPRRDGSPAGLFLRARLPDGTLKVMAIAPPGTAPPRAP